MNANILRLGNPFRFGGQGIPSNPIYSALLQDAGRSSTNVFDNVTDTYGSFKNEAEIERVTQTQIEDGNAIDFVLGLLDGFILQESLGEVGEAKNKYMDIGKGIGSTIGGFIPVIAGVISPIFPPAGAALMATYTISSVISGSRAAGDAFINKEYGELFNAVAYFSGVGPGAALLKNTKFVKAMTGIQNSQTKLSGLNKTIATSMDTFADANKIDVPTLKSSLFKDGKLNKTSKYYKEFMSMKVKSPPTSVTNAIQNPTIANVDEDKLLSALGDFLDKKNKGPKMPWQKAKIKKTPERLMAELKAQGENHKMWAELQNIQVETRGNTMAQVFKSKEATLKARRKYALIAKKQITDFRDGTLEKTGEIYENTTHRINIGRINARNNRAPGLNNVATPGNTSVVIPAPSSTLTVSQPSTVLNLSGNPLSTNSPVINIPLTNPAPVNPIFNNIPLTPNPSNSGNVIINLPITNG
ncbi:MAG: hypothetical protein MK033_10035 [Candidatus Caenarcaniphilales bacterium]|nr:hypothetical protein [Candidatus Caenarcaniphilales bacterium]